MQHAKMLPCYVCPMCDSKFNAPYPLRTHLSVKHDQKLELNKVKEYNNPIKNTKSVKIAKAKKKADFVQRKGQTCVHCGEFFTRVFNHNRHLPYCEGKKTVENVTATTSSPTESQPQHEKNLVSSRIDVDEFTLQSNKV